MFPAAKAEGNIEGQLKNTTNCAVMAKKTYALDVAGHKFAAVSRRTI